MSNAVTPEGQAGGSDLQAKVIADGALGDERLLVSAILEQHYGLALTSFQRLHGFDDVNYLVKVGSSSSNPHFRLTEPTDFILRIINAKDSKDPERTEVVNAVMEHVATKGLLTQTIVPSLQGDDISNHIILASDGNSRNHVIVLRTFLPGATMAGTPLLPAEIVKCGSYVARVRQALEDFHHPFNERFRYSWSLDNVQSIKEMLPTVADTGLRGLVEQVLDTYDQEATSLRHQLPMGQIHADVGFLNIILPPAPKETSGSVDSARDENKAGEGNDAPTKTKRPVLPPIDRWGLIDFHDTHRTFAITELAITSCRIIGKDLPATASIQDRLTIPGYLLAGYQAAMPLTPAERQIFPHLVMACLCVQLVGCTYYGTLNPNNDQCYVGNNADAWTLLETMRNLGPNGLWSRWEPIIQNEPRQTL